MRQVVGVRDLLYIRVSSRRKHLRVKEFIGWYDYNVNRVKLIRREAMIFDYVLIGVLVSAIVSFAWIDAKAYRR